jgi:hypothetical protein
VWLCIGMVGNISQSVTSQINQYAPSGY